MVDTNFDNGASKTPEQSSPSSDEIISFEAKLAQLQKQKEAQQKQEEDKALAPIRQNIQDTKQNLFQVNLLINAIKGGNGEYDQGIQKFSQDISQEVENQDEKIQSNIKENQNFLQSLGVNSVDDFVQSEEFANVQESIDYKQAQQNKEDLEKIDNVNLKDKLSALGIKIEESSDISYDDINQQLQEKKLEITKKLFEENLKTPEGKEKIIKEAMQKIKMPHIEEILSYSLTNKDKNDFAEHSIKFKKGDFFITEIKQIHKELEGLADINTIKEFVLKHYKEESDNYVKKEQAPLDQALQILDKTSPEKHQQFKEKCEEFQKLSKDFFDALDQKREEFQQKYPEANNNILRQDGVHKESIYYHMLKEFDTNLIYNDLFKKSISKDPTYVFQPCNYEDLNKYMDYRLSSMSAIKEELNKVKDDKDLVKYRDKLSEFVDLPSGGDADRLLNIQRLFFIPHDFDDGVKIEDLNYESGIRMLIAYKDWKKKDFLDKYSNTINTHQKEVSQTIKDKIDLEFLEDEFKTKSQEQGFYLRENTTKELLSQHENAKTRIDNLTQTVTDIESMLAEPQDIVITDEGELKVPSWDLDSDLCKDNIKKFTDNLSLLQKEYYQKSQQNPLLGKNKHKDKLREIGDKIFGCKQEIQEINNLRIKIINKITKIQNTFDNLKYRDDFIDKIINDNKGDSPISSQELFTIVKSNLQAQRPSEEVNPELIELSKKIEEISKRLGLQK